jgi:hypothetical protein
MAHGWNGFSGFTLVFFAAKAKSRKVFYLKFYLAKANHFELILPPAKAGGY